LKLKSKKKLIIFAAIIFIIAVYCVAQNNWVKVEETEVSSKRIPKEFDGFKIVQISDVHLPKNASSVKGLIKLVEKQKPDVIFMTGDIIDRKCNIETSRFKELAEGIAQISSCYFVLGNHEHLNDVVSYNQVMSDVGVINLNDSMCVLDKGGDKITLMGLDNYTPFSEDVFEGDSAIEDWSEIEDSYRILLAHRPELSRSYSDQSDIKPDLVFSGHAHGGQIRIPFVGGIFAPGQGFFPKHTDGLYSLNNNTKMMVSRGLGNSLFPIRINCRPHLPVVVLKSLED